MNKKIQKIVSLGLLVVSLCGVILPNSANVYANTFEKKYVDDGRYIEYDNGLSINGKFYTYEEFTELWEKSVVIQERSASAAAGAGAVFIPGVGQVIIIAGGVIIGGAIIYGATSWIANLLQNDNRIPLSEYKKIVIGDLPGRIRNEDRVNFFSFKDKHGNTPLNKKSGCFHFGRYSVCKDHARHGGRRWKLLKDGKRIASLDEGGRIIAK